MREVPAKDPPAPSPTSSEPAPLASPSDPIAVVATGKAQPAPTIGALPDGSNSVECTVVKAKVETLEVHGTRTTERLGTKRGAALFQVSDRLVP